MILLAGSLVDIVSTKLVISLGIGKEANMFINPHSILQMSLVTRVVFSPFLFGLFYMYRKGGEDSYLKQTSLRTHLKNIFCFKRYSNFWKKPDPIRSELLTEFKLCLIISLIAMGLIRAIIGISNLCVLFFKIGIFYLIKQYIFPDLNDYHVWVGLIVILMISLYPFMYHILNKQARLNSIPGLKTS